MIDLEENPHWHAVGCFGLFGFDQPIGVPDEKMTHAMCCRFNNGETHSLAIQTCGVVGAKGTSLLDLYVLRCLPLNMEKFNINETFEIVCGSIIIGQGKIVMRKESK